MSTVCFTAMLLWKTAPGQIHWLLPSRSPWTRAPKNIRRSLRTMVTALVDCFSPNLYVVLTNYDLTLFSSLARTSSPAALLALYPQLVILSSTVVGITNIPIPNLVTYLTNYVGSPFGSPPVQVTVTNSFSPNFYPFYNYTFGNIVTNVYSSSNRVTIQTI